MLTRFLIALLLAAWASIPCYALKEGDTFTAVKNELGAPESSIVLGDKIRANYPGGLVIYFEAERVTRFTGNLPSASVALPNNATSAPSTATKGAPNFVIDRDVPPPRQIDINTPASQSSAKAAPPAFTTSTPTPARQVDTSRQSAAAPSKQSSPGTETMVSSPRSTSTKARNALKWCALIAGLGLMLTGWIWMLAIAYDEHILWVLGIFFIPGVSLLFSVLHLERTKAPLLTSFIGVGLWIGSIFLGPDTP